ncbi:inorganic phosphate transporter [Candidatus Peregrinibacteria bacterium CG10_big_fil_rev_8_21_14_0_10_36_19]|nr:MAG: inorganic phosphate transporter [Candidatus Peregrinibacteria bacterium CG10_big_fil_rev_8_21_14_0_10_36_19]
MPSFEILAIIVLVIMACGDLIAGVVNDAVNFLNSAIGAKVSTRKTIMMVAAVGILIGATFSDGIIEVARKGIFHPEFFTITEVIMVFTAVAITDLILLDLFSTFGLPTSTTVSVVFELLGGALFLAYLKTSDLDIAWTAINSESAMKIITGILLSIAVAFSVGLIVQFITRLIFSFNYKKRMEKFGFLWSGIALTCLLFFILLKGGSNASFLTADSKKWIAENTQIILGWSFAAFSVISFILIKARVNILKLIILIGTGSLAMAFAGNDLANFIGVAVGGVYAYLGADLTGNLATPTWVLLLAGIIMTVAMFVSKKAETVTKTQINLASHGNNAINQWKTNKFFEKVSKGIIYVISSGKYVLPKRIRTWLHEKWELEHNDETEKADFDLLRGSVNLMVAAALISFATSQKLPLSTTYVTFMVAMGTALADGAWGKDCAPSRVVGVLAVVSGWFMTSIMAMLMTGITVSVIFYLQSAGLAVMVVTAALIVYKLSRVHKKRSA